MIINETLVSLLRFFGRQINLFGLVRFLITFRTTGCVTITVFFTPSFFRTYVGAAG